MAFISSAPFGICSINGFGFAPNILIGERIPDSVKPTNPECFFLLSSVSSGGQMDQSNPPVCALSTYCVLINGKCNPLQGLGGTGRYCLSVMVTKAPPEIWAGLTPQVCTWELIQN